MKSALNFAPSCSRSLQFFTDANEVEPLEEDDDDEDDEEDDDEDELWLAAEVVVPVELFLLPQPAAVTASVSTDSATRTRFISEALPCSRVV